VFITTRASGCGLSLGIDLWVAIRPDLRSSGCGRPCPASPAHGRGPQSCPAPCGSLPHSHGRSGCKSLRSKRTDSVGHLTPGFGGACVSSPASGGASVIGGCSSCCRVRASRPGSIGSTGSTGRKGSQCASAVPAARRAVSACRSWWRQRPCCRMCSQNKL